MGIEGGGLMTDRLRYILEFAIRQPHGWSLMTNDDLIELQKELNMIDALHATIQSLQSQLIDAEIRYASLEKSNA